MAQPQMIPISTDPQTQNQVAGILLLREAERSVSLTERERLIEQGFPDCAGLDLYCSGTRP